ncbi:MAG: alpha/beta hydrolase [Thiomonas sp.]|uniref:RBBP9/YdeN family alpha/beta hydrolase n=1 Tax=Thiomonas sp. TaxID=2047785 RepID=UPI002A3632F1|nr:alpha/beta hydrolase [Thiomonas sp.]MDY0331249.1 alpha/beta hydrolase [Thiomonas sp.]
MTRILLLPGWLGSDDGHWQRLWQKRYGDAVVEQDDWESPRRADWIARLEDVILAHPGPAALVGHSLGCHLIDAWSASTRHADHVACALLVAPPDLYGPQLPAVLQPWRRPLAQPALPFPALVVASTDDPYCHLSDAMHMAKRWGAQCVNLGPCGHINAASGLGDWPHGRRLLDGLLRRGRHNTGLSPA